MKEWYGKYDWALKAVGEVAAALAVIGAAYTAVIGYIESDLSVVFETIPSSLPSDVKKALPLADKVIQTSKDSKWRLDYDDQGRQTREAHDLYEKDGVRDLSEVADLERLRVVIENTTSKEIKDLRFSVKGIIKYRNAEVDGRMLSDEELKSLRRLKQGTKDEYLIDIPALPPKSPLTYDIFGKFSVVSVIGAAKADVRADVRPLVKYPNSSWLHLATRPLPVVSLMIVVGVFIAVRLGGRHVKARNRVLKDNSATPGGGEQSD